jgi:non-ribosomal peptide synthase protein (TIGR01720 family)
MVSNLLLAALRLSFREWTGSDSLLVDLEGHGRETFFEEIDLSRTVGWFTSIYPVLLSAAPNASPFEALRQIREQIGEAARHEVSYGLLRYLSPEPGVSGFLREFPRAEISFNYAGKFKGAAPIFMPAPERVGPSHDPAGKRFYLLEISGSIVKDQLRLAFRYSGNVHRQATIERLAKGTIEALKTLISGSA